MSEFTPEEGAGDCAIDLDALFEAVRDRTEVVTEALTHARAIVRNGDVPDLNGLQTQVQEICAAVQELAASGVGDDHPPRRRLLDAMEGMLAEMDTMEGDMKQAQLQLAESLDDIEMRQRAVTAYAKAPPPQPPRE